MVLARVEGHLVTNGQFGEFLNGARGPGYRPVTLAEAKRLLRAALRERALELESERLSASHGRTIGSVETYRILTRELTGSDPIGESSASGVDRSNLADETNGVGVEHRARIQRRAILDSLLDRSSIEVDLEQLSTFVQAMPATARPPLPPGVGFSPNSAASGAAS